MSGGAENRIFLPGLDVGSTISSGLLAAARVRSSSVTGRMELESPEVLYRGGPVSTPFAEASNDEAEIGAIALRTLPTAAPDKRAHLDDPERGTRVAEEAARRLAPEHCDMQVVISDGLSAEAIHHDIPELLPVLLDGLAGRHLRLGQPILAP
ncbi:MAG: ethanolamine ammonia-lyase light chain EutC [Gammaproteobacteria bacterium]